MGIKHSTQDIQNLRPSKEYINIERSFAIEKGRYVYSVIKSKGNSELLPPIYKLDCLLNKTIHFFPHKISDILKIQVNKLETHLLVQTEKKCFIYNLSMKKTTTIFDVANSFSLLADDMLYLQTGPTALMRINLSTGESNYHKINHLELARVQSYCLSSDQKRLFFVGSIANHESNLIAKFELAQNQVKEIYKSGKNIQKLIFSDQNNVLIASKFSGTISLYSSESLANKRNLRFSGSLLDVQLMKDFPDKIAACYEIDVTSALVIWNIKTMVKEKTFAIEANLMNSGISLLHVDNEIFYLQNRNRILFFKFSRAGKDVEKDRYLLNEEIGRLGGEVLKFSKLTQSMGRKMESQYINLQGEIFQNDSFFHTKMFIENNKKLRCSSLNENQKSEFSKRAKSTPSSSDKNDNDCPSNQKQPPKLLLEKNYRTKCLNEKNLDTSKNICEQCKIKLADVIFYPCKHNIICHLCSEKCTIVFCDICQKAVQRKSVRII